MLAAGTGLRQGEAFAVEVEAIDFLRRMLRVDRQLWMRHASRTRSGDQRRWCSPP